MARLVAAAVARSSPPARQAYQQAHDTQPPSHPPTRPPDAGVEEGSHAVEVQGSKGGGVLHGEAVVENGEAVVERPANGVLQVKLDSARQPFLMHANAHAHGHSSTSMRPPE